MYDTCDDVRIPENEIYNNQDALRKFKNERLGYFVTSYCNSDVFIDKKTRKLFRNAQKAMIELEHYLNNI